MIAHACDFCFSLFKARFAFARRALKNASVIIMVHAEYLKRHLTRAVAMNGFENPRFRSYFYISS